MKSRHWVIGILVFWITWGGIKFIRSWMPGFMRLTPQVQLSETKLEEYARLSGKKLSLPKVVDKGVLRMDAMKSDQYKHFYMYFTILDPSIDCSENSPLMKNLQENLWADYQQRAFKKFRDQGVVMVWRFTFVDGSKSFQLIARPEGISRF